MTEIADSDLTVQRRVCSRDEAIELFRDMGEHFKVEIIGDLPEGGGHFSVSARRMDGPVPGSTRP